MKCRMGDWQGGKRKNRKKAKKGRERTWRKKRKKDEREEKNVPFSLDSDLCIRNGMILYIHSSLLKPSNIYTQPFSK